MFGELPELQLHYVPVAFEKTVTFLHILSKPDLDICSL